MKQKRIVTILAATLATAGLAAAPAFAQTSSPSSANDTVNGSTTAPTTSGMGALNDSSSAGVNDPSRYDASSTHLNPSCYNQATGTWRTTGDCAPTG